MRTLSRPRAEGSTSSARMTDALVLQCPLHRMGALPFHSALTSDTVSVTLKVLGERYQATEWRKSHATVKADDEDNIGPNGFALALGIKLRYSSLSCGFVKTTYDCTIIGITAMERDLRKRYHAVVITGQPGVNAFLCFHLFPPSTALASSLINNNLA
jgi:hypothetical protein